MFRPSSANVLPLRYARPEGLNPWKCVWYFSESYRIYLQIDTTKPTEFVSVFPLAFS